MRRISISPQFQSDIRKIDRSLALRILQGIDHYARTDAGDVRRLEGESDVFRLRIGDWRVRFTLEEDGTIILLSAKKRSEAYR